ncbi:acyltransferase family protein [Melissococcus plutonius]|uniref:acyltransferase family protein n=1 Tax=Melissococcus plutonius TaxID=33970 RepID=UPI003EE715D7
MKNTKRLVKDRYITGFDGIRTIAVLGVILYHLFPTVLVGGYLGVPVFFAVSGYLITNLLRQEWIQTKEVDLKAFYIRRMKRLYPALIAMLVLSTAYITIFQSNLLNNIHGEIISSLLYLNNWWQIFQGTSYFDHFAVPSPFTHIWSLAVEAQYYLVWPIVFVLLEKFIKYPGKIIKIISSLTLLSVLLMALFYTPNTDPTRVYYGTDTRLFSILLGSAFAFIWPSYRLKKEIPQSARHFLNGVGIISLFIIIMSFLFLADHYNFVYYGGMFIFTIFAVLLVAVTAHPGADLNRWLTNPVFDWIGKRSYGIYLYQFPVMVFYEAKIKNLTHFSLWHSFIELLLILGISELSYRYIEKPFKKFHYKYSLLVLKDLVSKPLFKRWKIISGIEIFVGLLALYGLIIAPSNQIDAQQQELQEQIEVNKKKVEDRKSHIIQGKSDSSPQVAKELDYGLIPEEKERAKNMEISVIGDSVILNASADLQKIFPKMVIDSDVGRQLYASVPVVEKLKKEKMFKDTILIGLGTNGSFTEAQFNDFMHAIGEKKVYWINVRVPTKRWQDDVNSMLEEMKKKYKNLTIIDWYNYSNAHEEWFYDDHVHPNEIGRIKYATFVAKHLVDGKGRPVK